MKFLGASINKQLWGMNNPRRTKLIAVTLLLIALSLAGFSVIALFPNILSGLAGIVVGYPIYIRLTNAILAIVCAAFFLWPREGARLVGHWNYCIGIAFFTFFLQYGCRALTLFINEPNLFPDYAALDVTSNLITIIVVYGCSLLNNLLFLAAARILLNKNNKVAHDIHPPSGEAGLRAKLTYLWLMFRAALPGWRPAAWVLLVFLVFLLPLVQDVSSYLLEYTSSYLIWARFADAIFSTYCLSWFAYAIWLSFSVRRREALACAGFILVLAYGAGQLIYAANPLIAYAVSKPGIRERYQPMRRLKEEIDKASSAKAKGQDEKPTVSKGDELEPVWFFDGAIFAILSPMKYLLFLPAFFLYLLSIISVNDFRKALRKTTSMRGADYLSADGVLGVIGDSMGADEVKLLIRIPGIKRRQGSGEERVLAETWRAKGVCARGKELRRYPISDDPLLVSVMQKDGRVKVETNEDERRAASESRVDIPLPETLVLIPIMFHGGVIGALRVIFCGYGKYNDGTLEQLKFIAEHVAPSVQDFRTVSAVDKLSKRLSRVHGGRLSESFEDAARRIVGALQDLLNALGVSLILECGFKSLRPIYPEEGPYYDILKAQEASYKEVKKKVVPTPDGPVRVEKDQLPITTETGSPYKLGNLILAIPDDRDEIGKPTLGAYYLTRRTLSSLIAQIISNAARTALLTIIQELNDSLNVETLTVEEWFAGVEEKIKKAGLLWVVASEGEGTPLRGQPEHVALIGELNAVERDALFSNPLGCVPVPLEDSAARHIIHLRLSKPGQSLLLGVARTQFGRELNFRSPWKVFLESLANSAGAALARIEDRRNAEEQRRREEEERLRVAEDELVETVGIISAMQMHALVNMVQDQSYTVAELLELAGSDAGLSEENLINSLTFIKESTAMLLELACTWKELIRGDQRCSCNVRQAARQALRLFRFGLVKKQIDVDPKIPPGASARVPSNFLALAFASLIGNAIDATKPRGTIEIIVRADAEDDYILCDVIDDGSPIPEDMVPLLFQRGTTNKNEHSGWGLYLVSRLLKKYGGEVFLSYSNKEATCLTLRLPASPD